MLNIYLAAVNNKLSRVNIVYLTVLSKLNILTLANLRIICTLRLFDSKVINIISKRQLEYTKNTHFSQKNAERLFNFFIYCRKQSREEKKLFFLFFA